MNEGKEPAGASELENSLARWAALVAAVLLVVSMAAMPSVVAGLDEDAAGRPDGLLALDRADAARSPPAAQAPRSVDGGIANPDETGVATVGLWSPATDGARARAPAEAGYGALSDEEWLAHVMQGVGERANRTVAAAVPAMDSLLFDNRPAPASVLLPPAPARVGPTPGGIPAPIAPRPAGPAAAGAPKIEPTPDRPATVRPAPVPAATVQAGRIQPPAVSPSTIQSAPASPGTAMPVRPATAVSPQAATPGPTSLRPARTPPRHAAPAPEPAALAEAPAPRVRPANDGPLSLRR